MNSSRGTLSKYKLAGLLAILAVLSYQIMKLPVTTRGNENFSPVIADAQQVAGVVTPSEFAQRNLCQTGRQLDVAIQGEGFFRVKVGISQGDGTAYTRDGNFFVDALGEITLGLGDDGYHLLPGIIIPYEAKNIVITPDGDVTCIKHGGATPIHLGQIQLSHFANPNGLSHLGENLFQETAASGPPTVSKPGQHEAGQLVQKFLESGYGQKPQPVDQSSKPVALSAASND